MSGKVFICGGGREERGSCPNPLHDWPLPSGYVSADEAAHRRLRSGWKNTKCPDCGLYGWREGRKRDDSDVRVPADNTEED